MAWHSVNINNSVRFKLDAAGEKIWTDYWRPYSGGRDPLDMIKPDADGWRTDQMWQVMAVFGPHLHCGMALGLQTEIQVKIR